MDMQVCQAKQWMIQHMAASEDMDLLLAEEDGQIQV